MGGRARYENSQGHVPECWKGGIEDVGGGTSRKCEPCHHRNGPTVDLQAGPARLSLHASNWHDDFPPLFDCVV